MPGLRQVPACHLSLSPDAYVTPGDVTLLEPVSRWPWGAGGGSGAPAAPVRVTLSRFLTITRSVRDALC